MSVPEYQLTLHKTYFEKGFFNLGVQVERFVTMRQGELDLLLGSGSRRLKGRVTRKANLNGTPRVFVGKVLNNWFQANFQMYEIVKVNVLNPTKLQLVPVR